MLAVMIAGNKFPSSFESTVRKIMRQLMHVLSHVYLSHWQHLVELQLHPHFNTLVYHVMLFSKQFELIDAKDSDVLEELFDRLRRHSHAMSSSLRVSPTREVTDVDDDTTTANTEFLSPPAELHAAGVEVKSTWLSS